MELSYTCLMAAMRSDHEPFIVIVVARKNVHRQVVAHEEKVEAELVAMTEGL